MVQAAVSAFQTGRFGGAAKSKKSSRHRTTFSCLNLAALRTLPRHRISDFLRESALCLTFGIGHLLRDFTRAMRAAEERLSKHGKIAETAVGPIQYSDVGQGPVILLIHGAGGGFDQGHEIGVTLVDHGFRTISISRFGYLGTPMPKDASPAAQADAYAALLDALDIPEVIVVAASAGTPSALQFAIRHTSRAKNLVLMAPATYVPRANNAPSLNVSRLTRQVLSAAVLSDFSFWAGTRLAQPLLIKSLLATSPEMLEAADASERDRAAHVLDMVLPISARRAGLLHDLNIVTSLSRFDLEKITAPTLIFSAEDDYFGTYEAGKYTAEQIPGARFVGFKDGGHLAVGHEKEVLEEILAFLK